MPFTADNWCSLLWSEYFERCDWAKNNVDDQNAWYRKISVNCFSDAITLYPASFNSNHRFIAFWSDWYWIENCCSSHNQKWNTEAIKTVEQKSLKIVHANTSFAKTKSRQFYRTKIQEILITWMSTKYRNTSHSSRKSSAKLRCRSYSRRKHKQSF